MQNLNSGEYTGEIIQQKVINDITLTNTIYSVKRSNPDWHSHENMHLCLVFEPGKAETKNGPLYTQKGGTIFSYHSDEVHKWTSHGSNSKSVNIEIDNLFLSKNGLTDSEVQNNLKKSINAKSLILKIQREMLMSLDDSEFNIQLLLNDLLFSDQKYRFKGNPEWVYTLTQYLHDQWNQATTLSDLSEELDLHPVTISKGMRTYLQCTLGEYKRRLKIEKSLELIKTTKDSLTQIALTCGFADQSHFTRIFKLETGFLPKSFRRF